jgi:arsenate reductase-like glutaredoxin family protein
MCSSVAIVFSRANNRIALWRVVDILRPHISRECLQELFKLLNMIEKTSKLETVMMNLTLRMQATSTSSL